MAQKKYTETLTVDGDSETYAVRSNGRPDGIEPVSYAIGSTWGGGTMTLYVCFDPGAASPLFTPVANGAWTSDIGDKFDMPAEAHFKFTLSGSAAASLKIALSGYIEQVS